MKLENTITLITGGGRGIGKATAILFAKEGSDIAICARTKKELEQTKKEVDSLGRKCLIQVCDVRNPAQIKLLVNNVLKKFKRIDFLVNNAGFGLKMPFEEMSEEQIKTTLDTNLTGLIIFTKNIIPIMKKQKSGRIINISSGAGHTGYPGFSVYCSTKFGVLGFTESLAPELESHGIKILAVCPGATDTKMYREHFGKKAGTKPEQVAEVILKAALEGKSGSCMDVWDYI